MILIGATTTVVVPPVPRRSPAANRGRPRTLLMIAVLATLTGLTPEGAAIPKNPGAEGHATDAKRLMTDIERARRATSLFFAMNINLSVGGRHIADRRVLGLQHADLEVTRLLYVYTWPSDLRGCALVIEDSIACDALDHIRVGLPGLSPLHEVDAGTLSLLVPGTGLSYEDARGFLPAEKYNFAVIRNDSVGRRIEAHPRTDSIARVVGSARLLIDVDPDRLVMTGIEFFDGTDHPIKRYRASDFTRLDGGWLPTRMQTWNASQQLDASISFDYRRLPTSPPPRLFQEDPERSLLDRLREWRDHAGLGPAFPDSITAREH